MITCNEDNSSLQWPNVPSDATSELEESNLALTGCGDVPWKSHFFKRSNSTMEQVNGVNVKSSRFLPREHQRFQFLLWLSSLSSLWPLGSTDAIDTAFAVGIGGVSDIEHFPNVRFFSAEFAGELCLKQQRKRDERQNFDAKKKGFVIRRFGNVREHINYFCLIFLLISAGSQLVDPGRVAPVVLGRPEQWTSWPDLLSSKKLLECWSWWCGVRPWIRANWRLHLCSFFSTFEK